MVIRRCRLMLAAMPDIEYRFRHFLFSADVFFFAIFDYVVFRRFITIFLQHFPCLSDNEFSSLYAYIFFSF